jgi:2-methylisocitrate lyase-like PEP mutase family enzyme
MSPTQAQKAASFLDLHRGPTPLLMPNPWDIGSARLLASLGFQALATTSGGFAASLGRLDGGVSRDEAIAHGAELAAAVDVPVSADLENCFADDPDGVAATVGLAVQAGLSGCSVEDFTGDMANAIYDRGLAVERVAAAAEAAHRGPVHMVVSARCENLIRGRDDLDDTIDRLQAYEAAGADVLFAPGLRSIEAIRRVVASVGSPVNVLVGADSPPVAELAEAGVGRVSVGSSFAWAALGGLVAAGTELLREGTYGYSAVAAAGRAAVIDAFRP